MAWHGMAWHVREKMDATTASRSFRTAQLQALTLQSESESVESNSPSHESEDKSVSIRPRADDV